MSAALIGGAVIFCSRPTGLSGCVTMPTSSCSDFSSARNVGTPISPVPIKTIRICGLSKRLNRNVLTVSARDALGRYFLTGGDFALPDRRTALGAEVIENLPIGQN